MPQTKTVQSSAPVTIIDVLNQANKFLLNTEEGIAFQRAFKASSESDAGTFFGQVYTFAYTHAITLLDAFKLYTVSYLPSETSKEKEDLLKEIITFALENNLSIVEACDFKLL